MTQAIQTIQGLLFGTRNGLLNDKNWTLADPNFDELWRWMGSYDTWRAAVLAFLYPENLLRPSLRRDASPGFLDALQLLRDADPIAEQDAFTAHDRFARYLNDVAGIDLVAGASRVLVTGLGGVERTAQYLLGVTHAGSDTRYYWSFALDQYDDNGDPRWWYPIAAFDDIGQIHVPTPCGPHWVFVSSTAEATARRLEVWRQLLPPSTRRWTCCRRRWRGRARSRWAAVRRECLRQRDGAARRIGLAPILTIEADEQTIYFVRLRSRACVVGRFKATPNQVLWREVGRAICGIIRPTTALACYWAAGRLRMC